MLEPLIQFWLRAVAVDFAFDFEGGARSLRSRLELEAAVGAELSAVTHFDDYRHSDFLWIPAA